MRLLISRLNLCERVNYEINQGKRLMTAMLTAMLTAMSDDLKTEQPGARI